MFSLRKSLFSPASAFVLRLRAGAARAADRVINRRMPHAPHRQLAATVPLPHRSNRRRCCPGEEENPMADEMMERLAALEKQQRRTGDQLRLWRGAAGALLLLGLLLPMRSGVAQGNGQDNGLPGLQAEVAALKAALADEVAARKAGDASLQAEIDNIQSGPANQLTQAEVTALQNFAPISSLFSEQTSDFGPEVFLTGANLHIVNGLGATNGEPGDPEDRANTVVNGLGNLIVGYNENLFGYERTGSHNIVAGAGHGWKSFGGLVVGHFNRISGQYASVSGGTQNRATDYGASVSGGVFNTSSNIHASVSGGAANTASGLAASVSGGMSVVQPQERGWSAGGYFYPNGGIGDFHSP
jgi:hypothetical protein